MKKTNTILDDIVAAKRDYLKAKKSRNPRSKIDNELYDAKTYDGLGFYEALKANKSGVKIIAEVKLASPSEGILREPFNLEEINKIYQESDNVAAISVVTEREYFQGSEDFLAYFAKYNLNHKPLLRKDFLFDTYQIVESKLLGAHAYLLIASLFEYEELRLLIDFGLSIGIEPLVEVHTADELKQTMATKARCIGVNSRDLNTFKIHPDAHLLLKQLDDSYVRVAESGINTSQDIDRVSEYSDAALIGSHFMRSKDIRASINELVSTHKARKLV